MGISALLASQILDASATGRSVITGADASAIRTTLGLGTLATQSPTGTPSASTFLRGDYSWQTIDLSGYVPYTGATGAVNLGANGLTASRATLATGTITASTPAINVTQTWNNAATTFTGILANVTDTASASGSLLLDLQVGGTSRFRVTKAGSITAANLNANFVACGDRSSFPTLLVGQGGSGPDPGVYSINAWSAIGFSAAGGNWDVALFRDAAGIIAQRNSTNAQTFRIYNTFTDSSNYERGQLAWESNVLVIGTEAAGTGIGRDIRIRTNSGNSLTLSNGGELTMNSSLWLSWSSRVILESPGFGILRISDSNRTGFERLQLGGTTSSFPAIKRNAAALNFRLADDSAGCDITAAHGTFSAGTDTVSNPILNLSQTWNNAATTFTGILANVTDTASNAASLLMDLQVGGTSKFRVRKGGEIVIAGGSVFRPIESGSGASKFAILQHHLNVLAMFEGQTDTGFAIGDTAKGTMNGAWVNLAGAFGWYGMDGSTPDVRLLRDAANTLGIRNSTNSQCLNLYGTYTDASNYRRLFLSSTTAGAFTLGVEGAGTGASGNTFAISSNATVPRLGIGGGTHDLSTFRLHVIDSDSGAVGFYVQNTNATGGGVPRIAVAYGGTSAFGVTAWQNRSYIEDQGGNGLALGADNANVYIYGNRGNWNTGITVTSGSRILIGQNTDDGSTRVQINGAIKAAAATFSGNVTVSAVNIVTDTTTGTKIGTATTQKLGFYNATPVVQPTAVANATDAASVITQLNALLSRMRDLGLIAT